MASPSDGVNAISGTILLRREPTATWSVIDAILGNRERVGCETMMDKPLAGLRVLDLGQGVAAPYCGLLLAQYGAEVVKVEPLSGDWMRGLGEARGDQTAYSITYNWGKRGIAVDMKDPRGLDVVRRIAARSDVVLENFRPGVVDRLGIGFEDVKALSPRVLYVSVSGFGQSGPYGKRPGSDTVLQAFSGLVAINKDMDGRPHRVGTTMVDALTGLCAFQATSMALFGGVKEARLLDVSLLQSAALLLTPNIADFHLSGGPVAALNAPAGTYRTSDGWIAITFVKEKQFGELAKLVGLPDLPQDPRFTSFQRRAKNSQELIVLLQERFLTATTIVWTERCTEAGVLASPVNDCGDWLEDPQVQATNAYDFLEQPGVGDVPMPRLPGGLPFEGIAPGIGSDTRSVLADHDYTFEEIGRLLDAGVVREPGATV
jgi:crotonobetainyl-CoA:carnitine CoA-transferase CaiB-like acyl-CoA transferase